MPQKGMLSGADIEGIVARAWRKSLLAGSKSITPEALAEVIVAVPAVDAGAREGAAGDGGDHRVYGSRVSAQADRRAHGESGRAWGASGALDCAQAARRGDVTSILGVSDPADARAKGIEGSLLVRRAWVATSPDERSLNGRSARRESPGSFRTQSSLWARRSRSWKIAQFGFAPFAQRVGSSR